MSEQLHIVVLDAEALGNDILWDDLKAVGQCTLHAYTEPEQVLERMRDAHIVLTNKVLIRKEHIEGSPKLQYIGTIATGYNQVDAAAAAAKGIPVCNVPDYSTHSVAQHTFALLLEFASKVHLHARAVQDGEWATSKHFCFWKEPLIELAGKKFGVVGFGNTGQAVARIANAMGMDVLAYAPRPKAAPEYQPFSFVAMDTLFKESDVVSLHCPLTKDNKGFINKKQLSLMQKTAYLLNCSRGPLVNEADLAEALHAGTIAGAGLDVVSVEPMFLDNPLRTAPNCIITPHIAWASFEARQRLFTKVVANVVAYLQGKAINIVNGVVLT